MNRMNDLRHSLFARATASQSAALHAPSAATRRSSSCFTASDGSLTAPEIEYLARVSEIFGFTEEDFHRWLALHGDEGPRPWDVLGVDPAIPDDELRTRWKALVRDHHPDKLVADGMPEEFVAAANDRLARINAAYDSMMRSRGFGGAPAGGAV